MASKDEYVNIVEILAEHDSAIWKRQEEFAENIWEDEDVVSTISQHFIEIIKEYNTISEDEEKLLEQEIREFYINKVQEDIFGFSLGKDCYPASENIISYRDLRLHYSFKDWLKTRHKHLKAEILRVRHRGTYARSDYTLLHPIMGLEWCDEKVSEHWENLTETYWTDENNFTQMFAEITETLDMPDDIPEYEQLYEYLWSETPLLGLRNNKILKPDVFDSEYAHIIKKIKRINKHAQKTQPV